MTVDFLIDVGAPKSLPGSTQAGSFQASLEVWRRMSEYTSRCFMRRSDFVASNTAFAVAMSIIPAGTSKILQFLEAVVRGQ